MRLICLLLGLTAHPCSIDYSDAYQHAQSGQQMVVYVGAKWCPACRELKKVLCDVDMGDKDLTMLDCDVDSAGNQIVSDPSLSSDQKNRIPQLVLYQKVNGEWYSKRLVGSQTQEAVQAFLNSGF